MNKERVYIGTDKYKEEIYLNLKDGNLGGWSCMGLRPATMDELIEIAKDTEITDYFVVPKELERYIDHEKFEDDCVDGALEHHDVQGEYNIDGITYYLGFGSGTNMLEYFTDNKISNYNDFCNHFIDYLISVEQFNDLMYILQTYKKDNDKGYKLFLDWVKGISKYPKFTDEYKEV